MKLFKRKEENSWIGRRRGKVITISLKAPLYQLLDEYAKKYNISKNELIRMALIEFFTNHQIKSQEEKK